MTRRRHQGFARRPSRGAILARTAGWLLTAGIVAWCAGLVWFSADVLRPAAAVANADGIVVLTGGAGRIETALDLLAGGHARLMLISGVSGRLDLDEVLHAAGRQAEPAMADSIALGHGATSTVGNAMEAASWARVNGLHALIVVTASYHMRRALAEIGTALPDATLIPDPVRPPALSAFSLGTLRLLASEYTKWLVVESGLTGWAHLREIA